MLSVTLKHLMKTHTDTAYNQTHGGGMGRVAPEEDKIYTAADLR